jgi:uncharacterized membrane protein YqjE
MARLDRRPPPVPPRDAFARLIDGVQTLFREHVALAKAEIKDDVRRTGRSLLLSGAGLPPLFVGYVLLMVAIALVLQLFLASWAAFGIVALANLIVGAALTLAFTAKVRAEKLALVRTAEELRRDREWISSMRNGDERLVPARPRAADAAGTTGPPRATTEPSPARESRERNPALPAGKAGATPDLGPRSFSPGPGRPVAGATSTPNGEPMTAERNDAVQN